jgi:glycogen operon protein
MCVTDIFPGQSYPLGATIFDGGVNFCVFSRNATAVEILLFDDYRDSQPSRIIPLNPRFNRTFYYWHAFIPNIGHGQLYGYHVHGPHAPRSGLRFDGQKLLIDPYARCVAYGENYDREAAKRPGDNTAFAMKSVVIDGRHYDWEGDRPLNLPFKGSVIYEMHVGGFTAHPSSGLPEKKRGTYAGVIEKIPHLKDLGITTVELLPVYQFDNQDAPGGLSNYWGYSPINFFAPHRGYCSCNEPTSPVDHFRDMVKAFHQAGIEVILDVVYNHTAEGSADGPTLSFRGLENRAYYILDPRDRARYADYSGCGNTLKANHSVVKRMILDSLHYWVQTMHVDGFRFDLASTMSRDELGNPLASPPILWEIESDPILAGTKIIAEAWDAAGLYQVGSFIGHRWAEWNGHYRDDVRSFIRGDLNSNIKMTARIGGSRDLYPQPDREPHRSINFVTCHDGFTLHDLVSYDKKHNLSNNQNNQDGSDYNLSWNCGIEGPTSNPEILALRRQQMRNLVTTLFVSQGTPMILMGDEAARSQKGNNNGYCQNNDITWFNWDDTERNSDLLRFIREMIVWYKQHDLFLQERFWIDSLNPQLIWHGTELHKPDFRDISHSIAFELKHPRNEEHLFVIFNAYWEMLEFSLPRPGTGSTWARVVDTSLLPPDDFSNPPQVLHEDQRKYRVNPRSAVILETILI